MRTDHAAMRGCHGAAYDLGRVGLKMMKPALFAGCLFVSLPLTSTTATAHVKWFVNCNVSDDPLPAEAVFTATFLLFFTVFLVLLYLGCIAERTALGANISQLLDRYAAPLHRRADDLLRSVASASSSRFPYRRTPSFWPFVLISCAGPWPAPCYGRRSRNSCIQAGSRRSR